MNIVIVDDESIIREWFVFMISNFNENKFKVVKEAKNGKDAYDYCINNKVDLVVTDIKMPVMDGIELIKKLKKEKPEILSLVLTSHEDFNYAKDAIKYGAKDYILKAEIEKEELKDQLIKINNEIERSNSIQNETNTYQNVLNKEFFKIRNILLKDLINGKRDITKTFFKKKDILNINLIDNKDELYNIMAIGVKDYVIKAQEFYKEDNMLFDFAIINILEELIIEFLGNGCAFDYYNGYFVIIANFNSKSSLSLIEKSRKLFLKIRTTLKNYLNLQIAGVYCTLGKKLSGICQIKDKIINCLNYQMFYEKNSLLSCNEIVVEKDQDIQRIRRLIIKEVVAKNLNTSKELLTEYYDNIKDKQQIKPKDVVKSTLEIAEIVKVNMFNYGKNEIEKEEIYNIKEKNATISSIKEMIISLLEKSQELIDKQINSYSEPIRKILKYIDVNYHKDINLSDMADQVNLNKSYLSVLFKNEVGENFVEYLAKFRIEKSKVLLQNKDKSLNEIAEEIGYTNASYFTRVFKKNTGILPSEYRKSK